MVLTFQKGNDVQNIMIQKSFFVMQTWRNVRFRLSWWSRLFGFLWCAGKIIKHGGDPKKNLKAHTAITPGPFEWSFFPIPEMQLDSETGFPRISYVLISSWSSLLTKPDFQFTQSGGYGTPRGGARIRKSRKLASYQMLVCSLRLGEGKWLSKLERTLSRRYVTLHEIFIHHPE